MPASMGRDVLPSRRGATQTPSNKLMSMGRTEEQPEFPGRGRTRTDRVLHHVGLHTARARARKNPSSLS